MRSSILVLGVVASLAVSPAFASPVTDLITNGDFTNLTNGVGSIQNGTHTSAIGWVTAGYNFVFSSATTGGSNLSLWDKDNGGANSWDGKAAKGGNFLAMDGDYQTHAVSQTVSGLTVGKQYTLNFNYAFGQQKGFNGATIQHLTASVGDASLTTANVDVASHGFSGWLQSALTFTATNASENVSFLAYGNLPVPPFALVSNVSLYAVPGPEAGVGLLSFAMLGGLAFARRRLGRRAA